MSNRYIEVEIRPLPDRFVLQQLDEIGERTNASRRGIIYKIPLDSARNYSSMVMHLNQTLFWVLKRPPFEVCIKANI